MERPRYRQGAARPRRFDRFAKRERSDKSQTNEGGAFPSPYPTLQAGRQKNIDAATRQKGKWRYEVNI